MLILDGHDGTVLATWPGKWVDAAIHPSGKVLAATTHNEVLHIACFDGSKVREVGRRPIEQDAYAVALDGTSVAIAGDGTAARASLTVICVEPK